MSIIDQTCFICEESILLDEDYIVPFDNSCFVLVHKVCKKNFKGVCPVCKKENNNKCSTYVYASLLSLTVLVFVTAFVCLATIVLEKINS